MKKSPNVLLGGVIGNVVEWYDFALYGFMLITMSHLFFPHTTGSGMWINYLSITMIFGISFIVRPIGALLYGYYGDKYGRKGALAFSVIFMSIPTLLIGCLPTYATAGVFAPIFLLFLRLLQGISAGGEFGGSVTFCLEHATYGRRGLYASLPMAAAMLGVFLGALIPAVLNYSLSSSEMLAWGWRLPFLFSIVIAVIGFILRIKLNETPEFNKLKEHHKLAKNPVVTSFEFELREMITVALIVAFGAVLNYLILVFTPTFLIHQHKIHSNVALGFSAINLAIVVIFTIITGKFSDFMNRKYLLVVVLFVAAMLCWPLDTLINQGGAIQIFIAQCVFAVLEGMYFGGMMAYLGELFPAKIRYTSLSFGYNVGFAIFAGTAPILTTYITHYLSSSLSFSLIIFISTLISLIGVTIS